MLRPQEGATPILEHPRKRFRRERTLSWSARCKNVHCHDPGIDLTVAAHGKTMALHSGNYCKIEFTTLGVTPKGDLSTCEDLDGMSAKGEYVESSAKPAALTLASTRSSAFLTDAEIIAFSISA